VLNFGSFWLAMPPRYFPLRWESTGDQWWYASPVDWAAANGHYDLVRELLHLDTNLLIKLTSLRRIRRLETVWDDEAQFDDVAQCRSQVAQKLLLECETKSGHNSLIRAGYGGWLMYTAASAGDVSFVQELLERDPLLVFGEGEYGVTDIMYAAARSKNSEVFRLLLDGSVSSWSFESIRGEPQGEIPSVFRWEMMNRAVHAAARGGNLEILKELLGDCLDVLAYRDAQGSTVLHTASGRGQIEVVKDLLASYNIIYAADNQGNTALHMAAYRGHLPVVQVLISGAPSSVYLPNNYGDNFLHMAVAGFRTPGFRRLDQQIELMKQLVCGKFLNMQDVINLRNNDGRTALHMAVIENIQCDLVELLMTVPSINLNIRDADGMTPLDFLRQRPQSASSEILIKRLISAGGISNCQDYMARTALVSHLKLHGIGGSPGTSFNVSDAEIILYTGAENGFDASYEPATPSTRYDSCSVDQSQWTSPARSNLGSVSNAARRLKLLLRWPRRNERKADNPNTRDDESVESNRMSESLESTPPISLRQRFSRLSSLPNNRRVFSLGNSSPTPSTKLKFSAGLMHGVLRVMPRSPKSPFSESSRSLPISTEKVRSVDLLHDYRSSEKSRMSLRQNSLNKRLMNRYFCFGAEGLAVEDSIRCTDRDQSYKRPVVL
ncbi:hypothetical protein RJ639_029132, partial [Escallonia herrerae]